MAALARAQESLANGYTMNVTVANFVLPQWGGSDSGTVEAGPGGATARAQLRRTGEDSSYTIMFIDNTTFFKRGTCGSYARIPGGGAEVLSPFLLNRTNALASAQHARFATADHTVIAATIAGLGDALVTVDASSGRVKRIEFGDKPNNTGSTGFSFEFTKWETPSPLAMPTGTIVD